MDSKQLLRLANLTAAMKRSIPPSHKEAYDIHQAPAKIDDAMQAIIELAKLMAVADYITSQPEERRDVEALAKLQGPIKMYQGRLEEADELEGQLTEISIDNQIELEAKAAGAINPSTVATVIKNRRKLTHTIDIDGNLKVFADGQSIGQAINTLMASEDTKYMFDTSKAGAKSDRLNIYGGKNPWVKSTFNLTEQGRIFKSNPELAAKLSDEAKRN